jgi:excisionase family DNA binding protein
MDVKKMAFSKAEAAQATSLSLRKIEYLIGEGVLQSRKIGGRIVIPASSLEALIDGNT